MNIKVRVTCFWEDDRSFMESIQRFGQGSITWKNIEFVRDDTYDRLVILTRPHEDMIDYDISKAITFLTEPPTSNNVRPHSTSAILPMYLPLPFYSGNIYGPLKYGGNGKRIVKDKLFSCVTSDLNSMEGHFQRLRLIDHLDKRIVDGLDVWGKGYGNTFFERIKCYKGEIMDKYDALWRYDYHFACENSFTQNYFTEKIADPIIAETLCFYDGCENIEDFIDDRAFVKVNVRTPLEATEKIIEMIQSDERTKRLKYIRQQKKRLLEELNPLNIIWMGVNEKDILKECKLK